MELWIDTSMYADVYLGGDCIYSNKIENKAVDVFFKKKTAVKSQISWCTADFGISGLVPDSDFTTPRLDMDALNTLIEGKIVPPLTTFSSIYWYVDTGL